MITMRYIFIFIATLWITPYSRCNDEFMSDEDLPDYDQEEHSYFYDKNGYYNYFEPKSSLHSNFTSALSNSRFERDANANLDTSVNRMKMIARITNGIYLTQGFIDGSITSDAFISELLHLGTATPTAIKAMGLDKLSTAFGEIATTKLENNTDTQRIELRFLTMDRIRKATADMGDVAKLPGVDDFKNQLVALQAQNNPQMNAFGKLGGAIKEFLEVSKVIGGLPDFIDPNDSSNLGNASISLGRIKQCVENLQQASQDIIQSKQLNFPPQFERLFEPIQKVLSGAHLLKVNEATFLSHGTDKSASKVTKANINKLVRLGALFKDIQSEMSNVRSIYMTRSNRPTSSLLYTNGLHDGSSDLHKVVKALNDEWIKSLTSDADSLGRALQHMSSIGTFAASVDASLGMSPGEKTNAIDKVSDIGKGLLPYADSSDKLISAMDQVDSCNLLSLDIAAKYEVKKVVDTFDLLTPRIKTLLELEKLADLLSKQKEALDKIIVASTSQFSYDEITKHLKALKAENGFKTIQETLQKVNIDVLDATKVPTISELTIEFNASYADVGIFQKEVAPLVTAFNCLQKVDNFEQIPIAVTTIGKVREIKSETIQKGVEAINKVGEASDGLANLEAEIQNLKGGRTPETDALNQLPDQATHSITLGSATRGILKMKQAIKFQAEFDVVLSHLSVAKDMMNKVQSLDAKDKTNLDALVALEDKFRKMSDALKDWKQGITVSDSKNLKDHAQIFLSAVNVDGIDEDLLKMSHSVGNLAALVRDQTKKGNLNKLKTALKNLDTAGLKMSDYSKYLPEAEKSLEALDLFFVKYGKTLHPPATPAPVVPPPPGNNNDNNAKNPEPAAPPEKIVYETVPPKTIVIDWWWIFLGLGLGIVLTLVAQCLRLKCGCCVTKDYQNPTGNSNNIGKEEPKGGEKKANEIPNVPEVEKTDPEKEKEKKKREKEFNKFLNAKVSRQRGTPQVDYVTPMRDGRGLNIDRDGGFIYMEGLYNQLMDYQKQLGFDGKTLRPQTFFEFFKAEFNHGLSTKKLDPRVSNRPKSKVFPGYPKDSQKALMKDYERYKMDINLNTAVISNPEFYSGDWKFIHHPANYVRMPNAHRWVLTYDPVAKPEDDKSPFLTMVWQLKPEYVCMIGDFPEDGKYIPLIPETWLPSGRSPKVPTVYFRETGVVCEEGVNPKPNKPIPFRAATDEELHATEVAVKKDPRQDPNRCTIAARPHEFEHLQFIPEPKGSVPQDPRPLAVMLTKTYRLDNIIVHCTNGLGLSASLVAANFAFGLMCNELVRTENKSARFHFAQVVNVIRSHRFKALEEPIQLALTAMILLDFTVVGEKLVKDNERMYKELMTCYAEAIEIQKEENERNAKENEERFKPEVIKRKVEPTQSKPATQDTKVEEKKAPAKKSKKSVEKSKKSKEVDDKSKEKSTKASQKVTVQKSSKSGKKPLGDTPFALQVEEAKTQEGSEEDQKNKSGKSEKKTLE